MPVTSYLQWLARRDKDLPMPQLRIADCRYYGGAGAYFAPNLPVPDKWRASATLEYQEMADRQITWLPDGEIVSHQRGLIVIDASAFNHDFSVEATLAHEWRHHWQAFNVARRATPAQRPNHSVDYRSSIVEFFTRSAREADALRYEVKMAPGNENLRRASWLGWPTRQRAYLLP